MTVSHASPAVSKLAALQLNFKQDLPKKIVEIESLCDEVLSNNGSDDGYITLQRLTHNLTGSAGTFGAMEVSQVARELLIQVELLSTDNDSPVDKVPPENQKKITSLLRRLKEEAGNWKPSDFQSVEAEKVSESDKYYSRLIYLLDSDTEEVKALIRELEVANYRVQHFAEFEDFVASCTKEKPAVILTSMELLHNKVTASEFIRRLKQEQKNASNEFPPVIFISDTSDINERLLAVRAGARRYFVKPFDYKKLIKTIDSLTFRTKVNPYRVLLIDDENNTLEYNATILRDAGMVVETLSNPLKGINSLEEFKPDILILDIYMKECSGLELTQVIRQDDQWSQMQIIYLSSEWNVDMQLKALSLGGDDFLVKPVDATYLVEKIKTKAKRTRWSNILNNDLQAVLNESKYQLASMNEHSIVSMADVAGYITYVNDKFCKISGYSREELMGKNHRILRSDIHSPQFYKDMWKQISQGNVWHGKICNLTKDGNEYWVESTIVPFLDDKGKVYKYVSSRTDITRTRQSEERLTCSQHFANIGTWDWNVTTGNLFWSEKIASLFGYKDEIPETTYDNFLAAIHPDDRERVIEAVNNCVENNQDYDIEHRVVWSDGSIHWLSEKGDVTRSEDGKPLHMLGVVQDIDQRKNAELDVLKRKKQLLEAQSLAKIGNWEADFITDELFWSAEIYNIFGYDADSFSPSVTAFYATIHPEDITKVKASEKTAEKTGSHDIVHRIIRPDGQVRFVHELAKAKTDASGKLVRLIGTVQDITPLMEAELRQSGINNIMRLIATKKERDTILEYMISHAETILANVSCSILLLDSTGKYFEHIIAPTLPDFYNEALAGLEIGKGIGSCGEAAYLGKRVIVENITTHPNWNNFKVLAQKAKLYSCWSEPFFSSSGDVLGTFTIYHSQPYMPSDEDINFLFELSQIAAIAVEQDISQKALVTAKKEAEKANKAKSQFLSNMSHELRTPMNSIIGFGQLLQLEDGSMSSESQQENVREIIKASNHLLDLINQVLDLAKIEAGHIDLTIEPVILGEIITESLQLVMPLIQRKGIEISLREDDIELTYDELLHKNNTVKADHTRLKQVLLNLLSNAIKYNCVNGQIIISYKKVNTNTLRISITDTGDGLNQKQQDQLFIAFNRLVEKQSNIEGTGIGLVITKNIIENMDGNIGVESDLGKGSTFWFELPTDTVLIKEHHSQQVSENKLMSLSDLDYQYTVLYIEDNPSNLQLVKQLLEKNNTIHMIDAHDGQLGVELAKEYKPDLILLDINLPGEDGFAVLKNLRKEKETCDIHIIAISANAMPQDIKKGLDAGFNQYITKPIDIHSFLDTISSALQKV